VRHPLRLSPGLTVLAGRAVAQAGFFAFTVGPALVLGDAEYNDLIVGVTVVMLAVIAPVAAFQQHLVRYSGVVHNVRDARIKSLVLASVCAGIGTASALAFGTPIGVTVLLAVGGLLSCIPSLIASLHALDGRFERSALADAGSGLLFVAAAVPLLITGAATIVWALAFAGVWAIAAIATSVGPLAVRSSGAGSSIGPMRTVLLDARAMIAIGIVAMAFNRADYLALSVVGDASEVTRYAIATRVVGPILIALGSLNNSLYVQQIKVRDDPGALSAITRRTSRRVGTLAIIIVPFPVIAVLLLEGLSGTFASKSLVMPTLLLALATVPYAFAIPYGFALNATGHERSWLGIITVATVADLVAVLALGGGGASTTATLWLVTQACVWLAVVRLWHTRLARARPRP
jgi:O-antigen/teichoic acid export membrane protein